MKLPVLGDGDEHLERIDGSVGLVLVIAVQFGRLTCISIYTSLMSTLRVERTAGDRLARVLTAWSVSNNALIAGLTALWGLLAELAGARAAIALAGLLALATPLLLPTRSALRRVACPDQPDKPHNITREP